MIILVVVVCIVLLAVSPYPLLLPFRLPEVFAPSRPLDPALLSYTCFPIFMLSTIVAPAHPFPYI